MKELCKAGNELRENQYKKGNFIQTAGQGYFLSFPPQINTTEDHMFEVSIDETPKA